MGIMLAVKGKISPRERELAVLRVGWVTGAPFEWSEHVVIARRVGITSEEIERVIAGGAAPGWNSHEAALLTAVDELLSRFMISDETWAVLAESWDEQQLMEFPVLVGSLCGDRDAAEFAAGRDRGRQAGPHQSLKSGLSSRESWRWN